MEALLLGIYSFFVWLIFIKLKLLPWTTPWKVGVAIFPVVGLTAMILTLNVVAPTTSDVRVVKYVVPIVSQVKGRVIEVPVDNNRPVKKGQVLFRIDPEPYESEVRALSAQLLSDEAKVGADLARLSEMQSRLPDAVSIERQLNEQLNQASSQVTTLRASLDLANRRVAQNTELAASGAGNRFDLEKAQPHLRIPFLEQLFYDLRHPHYLRQLDLARHLHHSPGGKAIVSTHATARPCTIGGV